MSMRLLARPLFPPAHALDRSRKITSPPATTVTSTKSVRRHALPINVVTFDGVVASSMSRLRTHAPAKIEILPANSRSRDREHDVALGLHLTRHTPCAADDDGDSDRRRRRSRP
jgi:hypothetical protein